MLRHIQANKYSESSLMVATSDRAQSDADGSLLLGSFSFPEVRMGPEMNTHCD